MKKIILLVAMLITSATTKAQESTTVDYCSKVKTDTDKFTGEVRSFTEMERGNMVMKVVSKGKTKYILHLNVLSKTAIEKTKGAIVLLENGKKIERPNAVIDFNANVGGNSFRYQSDIELTASELALLKQSPITDIRLHIFDSDTFKGLKLMEQTKCLSK